MLPIAAQPIAPQRPIPAATRALSLRGAALLYLLGLTPPLLTALTLALRAPDAFVGPAPLALDLSLCVLHYSAAGWLALLVLCAALRLARLPTLALPIAAALLVLWGATSRDYTPLLAPLLDDTAQPMPALDGRHQRVWRAQHQ
jgi:hypothetical protein